MDRIVQISEHDFQFTEVRYFDRVFTGDVRFYMLTGSFC